MVTKSNRIHKYEMSIVKHSRTISMSSEAYGFTHTERQRQRQCQSQAMLVHGNA